MSERGFRLSNIPRVSKYDAPLSAIAILMLFATSTIAILAGVI